MKKLILAAFFLGLGCGYSDTRVPSGASMSGAPSEGLESPGEGSGTSNLDFQSISAALFKPYCLDCHSKQGGNRGGVNLELYANVKARLKSILSAVNGGYMPPSGAVPSEVQRLLESWVQAGAPETASGNTDPGTGGDSGGGSAPVDPVEPCEDQVDEIIFDLQTQTFKHGRKRGRCDDDNNSD